MKTLTYIFILVCLTAILLCSKETEPTIINNIIISTGSIGTTNNITTNKTTTTNHITTNITTTTNVVTTRYKIYNSTGQTLFHVKTNCKTGNMETTLMGDINNGSSTGFYNTTCNIMNFSVWLDAYATGGTLCGQAQMPEYTIIVGTDNLIYIYSSWLANCY